MKFSIINITFGLTVLKNLHTEWERPQDTPSCRQVVALTIPCLYERFDVFEISNHFNQVTPKDEMPTSCSFCSKISNFILLKPLVLISNNTTAVTFFSSFPPKMASVVCISDVSVEWNFLFPVCDFVNPGRFV